jgi:hypothetical protein
LWIYGRLNKISISILASQKTEGLNTLKVQKSLVGKRFENQVGGREELNQDVVVKSWY